MREDYIVEKETQTYSRRESISQITETPNPANSLTIDPNNIETVKAWPEERRQNRTVRLAQGIKVLGKTKSIHIQLI